jgi:Glyoxalase-like domain
MPRGLQITIDCIEPSRLTQFWADLLGYVLEPPRGGFATWNEYWLSRGVPAEDLPTDGDAADSIVDPAGIAPRVWFQRVPEAKSIKNRVHLDVDVAGGPGVEFEVRRERVRAAAAGLVAQGATQLNELQGAVDHFAIVMLDPEGNEFCVH